MLTVELLSSGIHCNAEIEEFVMEVVNEEEPENSGKLYLWYNETKEGKTVDIFQVNTRGIYEEVAYYGTMVSAEHFSNISPNMKEKILKALDTDRIPIKTDLDLFFDIINSSV